MVKRNIMEHTTSIYRCFKMNRIIAISLFIVIGLSLKSNSQEYSRKYGKVSIDELKIKTCPFDESAEAMVLHDIGESHYEVVGDSYKLIYNRRIKVKVFSEAGLDVANFDIPFYEYFDEEKITELKGNVYNLQDGKIVITKLNNKNAYEEKINDRWFRLKFTMPNVKAGSVFEISYRTISPFVSNLNSWKFQREIPVLFSEYTVTMNQYYEFKSMLKGVDRCDEFEVIDGLEQAYRFAMKNIPAFRDEMFIASEDDYLIKLEFQLAALHYPNKKSIFYTSTWPKLCQELMERDFFGKYLRTSERRGDDIIRELRIDSLNQFEKAKIIERYVKDKYRYNGVNDYFASKNVEDFLETKTGTCGNINLFFCGLLNASGIEARPVLLSTRDNGQPQTLFPFLTEFNYVIISAIIDKIPILLDATDPNCNFGVLPIRCINDKGLIVNTENEEWTTLTSNEKSMTRYDFTLKPDPENNIIIQEGRQRTTGYDGINYRREYQVNYDGLAEDLLGVNYKTFDSVKQVNLFEIEKPFELHFSKSIEMESIEDKIMINPFCFIVMTENPMKQKDRKYPIDFTYSKTRSYSTIIEIPKGYQLLNTPENLVINSPICNLTYIINNDEVDKVSVTAQYQFKKAKYDASAYKDLKELYDMVVNKFNEKIVLVNDSGETI